MNDLLPNSWTQQALRWQDGHAAVDRGVRRHLCFMVVSVSAVSSSAPRTLLQSSPNLRNVAENILAEMEEDK